MRAARARPAPRTCATGSRRQSFCPARHPRFHHPLGCHHDVHPGRRQWRQYTIAPDRSHMAGSAYTESELAELSEMKHRLNERLSTLAHHPVEEAMMNSFKRANGEPSLRGTRCLGPRPAGLGGAVVARWATTRGWGYADLPCPCCDGDADCNCNVPEHPSQGWRPLPHHLSKQQLWGRIRHEAKTDAVSARLCGCRAALGAGPTRLLCRAAPSIQGVQWRCAGSGD
jgi:hypothetical protein